MNFVSSIKKRGAVIIYTVFFVIGLIIIPAKTEAEVLKTWDNGSYIITYNSDDTFSCTGTCNSITETVFISEKPIGNTYDVPVMIGGGGIDFNGGMFSNGLAGFLYPQLNGFGEQTGHYAGSLCFLSSGCTYEVSPYEPTGDNWFDYDYYVISGTEGQLKEPEPETRFTLTVPEDEEVVIDPRITFEAHWSISVDDLESLNTMWSGPARKVRVMGQVCDLMTNTWCFVAVDWILPTGFETATTSLEYTFDGVTTDRHLNYGENYAMHWSITGFNYYNLLGPEWTVRKTIYFSVGTTTESGHLRALVASTTQAELDSNTFYNGYSKSACNPISGEFNIVDCVLSLFYPDKGKLSDALVQLRSGLFTKQPVGYLTRFIEIMTNNATSTLPSYTIEFDPAGPLASSTLSFDPQEMITGGATLLESVKDPVYNKSMRDVFEPIVQLVIAMVVLYAIITDIIKSHNIHQQKMS